MTNETIVAQSNRLIAQIVDDLERLKQEFLLLNIEEVLTNRPDLLSLTLINLSQIRAYLETNPVMFLASCAAAIQENSD